MRNVLIISYYFPPMGLSGVQRTSKFVKYLPEYDWKPHVLTCTPKAYYAFDDTLSSEFGENVVIHRTDIDFQNKLAGKSNRKSIKYPNTTINSIKKVITQSIFQPDSKILWKKKAFAKGMEIIKNNQIDLIYATAPPFTSFLVANELSQKTGIPFVTDYRDLWVDNAYYFYLTTFHQKYAEKLETEILKATSKAIVISRSMKERMLKRYSFLNHGDIAIIPHGYDQADFNKTSHAIAKSNKFVITHAGQFQDDLTPRYLLKALSNLIKQKPEMEHKIELRFVGIMRRQHTKMIERYKLSKMVSCLGYLPHLESVGKLLESDVLWMMIPNDIATPSRFYEYLGARKPIFLNSPNGSLRQIGKDTETGIFTEARDVSDIQSKILEMYDLWTKNSLPKANESQIIKYERKLLTESLSHELAHAMRI